MRELERPDGIRSQEKPNLNVARQRDDPLRGERRRKRLAVWRRMAPTRYRPLIERDRVRDRDLIDVESVDPPVARTVQRCERDPRHPVLIQRLGKNVYAAVGVPSAGVGPRYSIVPSRARRAAETKGRSSKAERRAY